MHRAAPLTYGRHGSTESRASRTVACKWRWGASLWSEP